MQDPDYQDIMLVNLIENGMRQMIVPAISFSDIINLSAKSWVFHQGLETGDHGIPVGPGLFDTEFLDGVLSDVANIAFGSF